MGGIHRPGLHRPGHGCGNIQCADCYPLGGRKGAKNSEARKRSEEATASLGDPLSEVMTILAPLERRHALRVLHAAEARVLFLSEENL